MPVRLPKCPARVGLWCNWLEAGTSADDADAHVVETNGAGLISAQGIEITVAAFGVGGTPLPLIEGAAVAAGKSISIATGGEVSFTGTAKVTAVATTVIEGGLFEYAVGAAAPAARQSSMDTNGQVVTHDGSSLNYQHMSPNGWVYATGEQVAATGMAALLQVAETTVAATALGLGNVRVIVEGECQHAALPNTWTVDVQHDQGGWANIGAGKVFSAKADTSDANDWQPFRHERTFNAGTSIATKYRAVLNPAGGTGKVREVYTRVVNERA